MTSETHDRGGPLDALVNYWLTTIWYEKTGEARAVPEYNLEMCAGEALRNYLGDRKLEPSIAFDLGIELYGIVARDPLNAAEKIRLALDRAIEGSQEYRESELALSRARNGAFWPALED